MYRHLPWALSLLLLGCAGSPPAPIFATAEVSTVKALVVQGNVTLKSIVPGDHAGNAVVPARPLTEGAVFREDAEISASGPAALAGLAFSNGDFLVASSGARFVVAHYLQAPYRAANSGAYLHLSPPDPSKSTLGLSLYSGSLAGEIKFLNRHQGSDFEIYTALGAFSVHYSPVLFRISVARSGESKDTISVTVDCIQGTATFDLAAIAGLPNPQTFVVPARQEITLTGSDAPVTGSYVPPTVSHRNLSTTEIQSMLADFQEAKTLALSR